MYTKSQTFSMHTTSLSELRTRSVTPSNMRLRWEQGRWTDRADTRPPSVGGLVDSVTYKQFLSFQLQQSRKQRNPNRTLGLATGDNHNFLSNQHSKYLSGANIFMNFLRKCSLHAKIHFTEKQSSFRSTILLSGE